ncbi:hypothetical protein LY625_06740 [Lysobacter sp. GX 14042]|uniref:hypothetical protein n=1 Tax=Lysobacter sp. GX 14042 TaxID=2907155 RepID=UPI001F330310|nr:hypothetical protein [Lysobacter sp. GX 14042]MCE7032319.1 hypothetical protein [Lysobacter sp. GX 14042]
MIRAFPPLQPYANRSGDSGVTRYAVVGEAIVVGFEGGDCYLYDGVRPGPDEVRHMRELAVAGSGLSSYISRHVRGRYRARLAGRLD